MINKILIGVLAALLAAFFWANARLESAQARNALLGSANTVLAESLGRVDQQRQKSEQAAVGHWSTVQKLAAGRDRYERDLAKARQENEALREHLSGFVPGDIIDGLLLRAGQGSACADGEAVGAVSEGDTCSATVTFERLYRWAGANVDGLLSCNADKAAIRIEVGE